MNADRRIVVTIAVVGLAAWLSFDKPMPYIPVPKPAVDESDKSEVDLQPKTNVSIERLKEVLAKDTKANRQHFGSYWDSQHDMVLIDPAQSPVKNTIDLRSANKFAVDLAYKKSDYGALGISGAVDEVLRNEFGTEPVVLTDDLRQRAATLYSRLSDAGWGK